MDTKMIVYTRTNMRGNTLVVIHHSIYFTTTNQYVAKSMRMASEDLSWLLPGWSGKPRGSARGLSD